MNNYLPCLFNFHNYELTISEDHSQGFLGYIVRPACMYCGYFNPQVAHCWFLTKEEAQDHILNYVRREGKSCFCTTEAIRKLMHW